MARFRRKCLQAFLACFTCCVFYVNYSALNQICSCRIHEEDVPMPLLPPSHQLTQSLEVQNPTTTATTTNVQPKSTENPQPKSTPLYSEAVGDKYVNVGYFDLKGHDMDCAKGGNCEEFRVRSNLHGAMLCEVYGNACQGFVFAPNTGRLFLKRNVSGETDHVPDFEFHVKKPFLTNVKLILERQCAVPVESFRNSSSECVLPVLDPFNKNIMKFIDKNKVKIQCPGKRFTAYENGVLSLTDKGNSVKHIQVRSITRKQHSDWGFILTKKSFNFPRTNSSKINEEFLRIDIETAAGEKVKEFHAQVVAKDEVLKRKVKNKSGLNVNVLMVGFDSTSSGQMQRALPKVYRYLKDDLSSYIFRGYSIVGDGTTPQLTALLTGHTEAELPEARRGFTNSTTVDSWPWIFKEYRNHGYATMYSEDDPSLNAFNFRLHGFKDPPADHYSRTFWQATPAEGNCIKASIHPKLHLSYVESFMRAYKNTPKFGFAFLARISHGNMNSLGPAEEYVLTFIKSLKEKGLLDNTILMMFSDHGMRFGEARATMQCKLEERLPFLSITLPKRFREKHRELGDFLKENSQKLTSPFDIHATLHHILNYPAAQTDSTKTGMSLFRKIPENRGCDACGIPEHYCPCVQLKEASVTHPHIEKAAEGLVDHINRILNSDKVSVRKCAKLKLAEIKSAYQNLKHPKLVSFLRSKDIDGRIPVFGVHRQDYECNYHLLVRTSPGDALFEASVQLLDGKLHFENDISRINRYGDQPKCIAEERPYLRKFCFCKEQ